MPTLELLWPSAKSFTHLRLIHKMANIASPTEESDCMSFTIRIQPQYGLELAGVGAASLVYKVDDDIVLKACRVYERPASEASSLDKWYYASETLFHCNLLKDERAVMRLLEKQPHSNIVEAIDTDHDEGIYLRRYLPLTELKVPAQEGRILWYQDIARGLVHLHNLGIAHADLRIDNVLFDQFGHAFLCDFSAASPFGQPNPARPYPGLPIPINGTSEVISDATDRFAMGSLIFKMEHNASPRLQVTESGSLNLPEVRTGHHNVDNVIRKAWLGQYISTTQMLEDLEFLQPDPAQDTRGTVPQVVSKDSLRDRVGRWRRQRDEQKGMHSSNYRVDISPFGSPQSNGYFQDVSYRLCRQRTNYKT